MTSTVCGFLAVPSHFQLMSNPFSNSKSVPVPPVPKIGDAPILYKTSKIYVSASKNRYRIIRDAFNFSSERQIAFAKNGKPTPSTWKQALKVVDDYIRSKK